MPSLFECETKECLACGGLERSGGHRSRSRWVGWFLPGSFQEPIQTRAADAEQLGSADAVAFAHIEHTPDVLSSNFIQRKRAPGVLGMSARAARFLKVFGEVINVNEFIYGCKACTGNDIFQFTDVAGPGVLEQDGLRPPG